MSPMLYIYTCICNSYNVLKYFITEKLPTCWNWPSDKVITNSQPRRGVKQRGKPPISWAKRPEGCTVPASIVDFLQVLDRFTWGWWFGCKHLRLVVYVVKNVWFTVYNDKITRITLRENYGKLINTCRILKTPVGVESDWLLSSSQSFDSPDFNTTVLLVKV